MELFIIFIFTALVMIITIEVTDRLVKYRKRRHWKGIYDSIHVGDMYIKTLYPENPFDRHWGEKARITGKAVNSKGVFYVKYVDLDFMKGHEVSCPLREFLEDNNFVPYNNQDKEHE